MKSAIFLKGKGLFWYCGTLLIVICLLMTLRPESVPMADRAVMTLAVFIPIVFSPKYRIFLFACLWTINQNSFCAILPENPILYLLLAIVCYFQLSKRYVFPIGLFFAWLFFALVTFYYSDNEPFVVIMAIGVILFAYIRDYKDLIILNDAIVLTSLFFSILFLLNRDTFTYYYMTSDLERTSWMNANVFGSLICFGSVISIGHITGILKAGVSKIEMMLYIVTALMGISVLILNASRGAIVSFTTASVLFVLFSRMKTTYKAGTIILFLAFLVVLYNSGYFELLQYRFASDTNENIGNRSEIWERKLNAFEGFNPLEQLFGKSRSGSINIQSYEGMMSTHNDFLTALVGYGVIGFILYCWMYVKSFIDSDKSRKLGVFILLLSLALEASVVEPMFRGNFMFVVFFIYIYKYATISNILDKVKKTSRG